MTSIRYSHSRAILPVRATAEFARLSYSDQPTRVTRPAGTARGCNPQAAPRRPLISGSRGQVVRMVNDAGQTMLSIRIWRRAPFLCARGSRRAEADYARPAHLGRSMTVGDRVNAVPASETMLVSAKVGNTTAIHFRASAMSSERPHLDHKGGPVNTHRGYEGMLPGRAERGFQLPGDLHHQLARSLAEKSHHRVPPSQVSAA